MFSCLTNRCYSQRNSILVCKICASSPRLHNGSKLPQIPSWQINIQASVASAVRSIRLQQQRRRTGREHSMRATSLQLDVETNCAPARNRDLVFYTHTLCPYAQRVMLTLLEKGMDFEMVHIDLSSKPSWYRKVNPRGLVPAVQITASGRVEVESIDLCRLLDEMYSDVSLSPSPDSEERARMDSLISAAGTVVSSGLSMASGYDGRFWGIGSGASTQDVNAFRASLMPLEQSLLGSGGPHMLGEQITLADLILLPFMERFKLIACEMHGFDAEEALGPAVSAWLEAMEQRPAARCAAADPTLLLEAYRQHRSLDFFDYSTYNAADLHPHNRKP